MARKKLTEGEVLPSLISLILPMAWGIFMVLSFYLADVFFIGLLGTTELAAISFTFPVVTATASIAMGLGTGALSVISRSIGRGDTDGMRRYATHSLLLALLVVGLFVTVGLATIDPLFTALGASATLLPLIHQYMEIWYAGMIFLVVPMVGNSIIRASGDSRFPSMIMTVAAVGNFILDPLLIFGLFGLPRLELQWAALASLISRAITLLASGYVLHYRLQIIDFSRPKLQQLLRSWRAILHIGMPAAGTNLIAPLLTGMLTKIIANHGIHAVAAFGVASRIEMFVLIPFVALSAGLGPFIGQNFGAKKPDRLKKAVDLCNRFTLLWGGLVALLLWQTGEYITAQINSQPQVIAHAALFMVVVPISYGMVGIIFTASSTCNALGRPLVSALLALVRTFLLTAPLAWLANSIWGLSGIFAAISMANVIVGVVAYFWLHKNITSSQTLPTA